MPPVVRHPAYQFDLSGGALCLDFANTISWRQVPSQAGDHLTRYDDLVAFAGQSKLLSSRQAADLLVHARRHSTAAQDVLQRAITYRERLYRAFSALAEGKAVPPDDLQQVRDFAVEALHHRRLARANGHYRWEWQWDRENMLEPHLVADRAIGGGPAHLT